MTWEEAALLAWYQMIDGQVWCGINPSHAVVKGLGARGLLFLECAETIILGVRGVRYPLLAVRVLRSRLTGYNSLRLIVRGSRTNEMVHSRSHLGIHAVLNHCED